MDQNSEIDEIKDMLVECGVDPEDFDILYDAPIVLNSLMYPEHGMACCAAINKKTGLIMLLAFKMDKTNLMEAKEENLIIQ